MEKDGLRVMIVDDEPLTRMDLCELLGGEGYKIVAEAADGFDAIELCRKCEPDLVLMDIKMPLLDGLSALKVINEEHLAETVMLLTAYNEREFVDVAKHNGVSGYLVKPIDEKSLIPSIEMAVARSKEMHQLRKTTEKTTKRLENRIIIERAKGFIMDKDGLSEQSAYEHIRKLSRVKNISMRRIAEIILMKSEDSSK